MVFVGIPRIRLTIGQFLSPFFQRTPSSRGGTHGADARFPSERRQVDGLSISLNLVCNQEVRGSIPLRSIYLELAAVDAEATRLGLDIRDIPGLVLGGSLDRFLARLRAMQPGVTWSDVFPGLPKSFLGAETPPAQACESTRSPVCARSCHWAGPADQAIGAPHTRRRTF
jgi:hypothetical protein